MMGIIDTTPRTEESSLEDRVPSDPAMKSGASSKQVALIEVIL